MTHELIARSYDLDDIAIRADGTGRTVVAYAAIFDTPYEVRDFEGHYFEQLHRNAFSRPLKHGISNLRVLFQHGRTVDGTPSERYSMPIGTPLEVKPDGRGLLTVTRYSNTPLADEVLELIRDGSIRGQSFSGAIVHTRQVGKHNGIRLVERTELGLREYGPTTFPVNVDAEIIGVRSQDLLEQLRDLDDEDRAELLAQLSGPPEGDQPESTDPLQEPAVVAPPVGPSTEVLALAQAQRRRRA